MSDSQCSFCLSCIFFPGNFKDVLPVQVTGTEISFATTAFKTVEEDKYAYFPAKKVHLVPVRMWDEYSGKAMNG